MAYIPPHKRSSSSSSSSSTPTADSLIPRFNRNLNLRSPSSGSSSATERRIKKDNNKRQSLPDGKIIYASGAISRWFAVGLPDKEDENSNNTQFTSVASLQPLPFESIEQKSGEKPLALVLDPRLLKESSEGEGKFLSSPWVSVAENVHQDLFSSLQTLKKEMDCQNKEEVKPSLIARFGKVLFHGSPSLSLQSVKGHSVAETTLRQMKRSFYTNVPPSLMDYIINEAVPKVGLSFEEEKEIYHVKLSDKLRPDSTISCKCSLMKDCRKLELYKVEWNQVRYLVADISCLDKNLDLRLMLCAKRIISALTEDEMHGIRSLISSAVLDSDVKGGLRWPLGKETSGDRYTVVGVWHTNAKAFRNSSVRVKTRHADRFDFRTSSGEATREIALKLRGIISQLHEPGFEIGLVAEMLKSNLELIWKYFLSYNSST